MRKSRDLSKKNEKKVHISSVEQEKAHKKTSTPPNWDNVEEKIKRKIYINRMSDYCILNAVACCCS